MNNDKVQITFRFLLCMVSILVCILEFNFVALYKKVLLGFKFQLSAKSLSVLGDFLIILTSMEYIISIGNERFAGSCRACDLVEPLFYLRIF